MDYLEKEMYETLRSIGINHEDAILMARIRADMKRRDWLEQEWYDKLRSIGCGHEDALLLARLKAEIERDETIIHKIHEGGFGGFCRWVEIHCKDLYYDNIEGVLRSAWNWLKRLF